MPASSVHASIPFFTHDGMPTGFRTAILHCGSFHAPDARHIRAFGLGEARWSKSARGGCECGTVAAIAGSVNGAAGLAGCFDLLVGPYVRFGRLSVFFGAADLAFMLFFEAFVHKSRIPCRRLPRTSCATKSGRRAAGTHEDLKPCAFHAGFRSYSNVAP
jgi:hypothetical protein